MTWQEIEGHDAIAARFRQALSRGRLASTFLFVGPSGVGKRMFALKLAQGLFCQTMPAEQLAPCGHCAGCVQTLAGTHPDLHVVSKPADKSAIPVSAFIGDDQHRMREGLCHEIALKPFMGGRRVAIIEDADYLNEEGANALLKTLEEPPPRSVLILIATIVERQLPTIRSRAQIVRFAPLEAPVIARLLSQCAGTAPDEAARLAAFAEGSIERAQELADPELWSFRSALIDSLAARPLPSVALTQTVETFVNDAGTDASARRMRCRQAMTLALDFFRAALRQGVGSAVSDDAELSRAVARAAVAWGLARDLSLASDLSLALIDRTLEALGHVDRNANQSTLIACWLDDLAAMIDPGRAPYRFKPGALA